MMNILKNLTEKCTPQGQRKLTLSVIGVIAISIIALIIMDVPLAHAEVMQYSNYRHDQRGNIAKEKEHKAFVICASCPPVKRLSSIKAIFPLAIKADVDTNIDTEDISNPSRTFAAGTSSVQKATPQTTSQAPSQTYFHPAITQGKYNQEKTIVYFDFDSAVLKDSEKNKINLAISPNAKVDTVTGYTCDIGTKEYNDRLALKRAGAVSSYLKEKGVIPSKVEGKGKCCYVSEEKGLKSLNRRVEITVPPDQKILKGDIK